jgi:hypothetical protein
MEPRTNALVAFAIGITDDRRAHSRRSAVKGFAAGRCGIHRPEAQTSALDGLLQTGFPSSLWPIVEQDAEHLLWCCDTQAFSLRCPYPTALI